MRKTAKAKLSELLEQHTKLETLSFSQRFEKLIEKDRVERTQTKILAKLIDLRKNPELCTPTNIAELLALSNLDHVEETYLGHLYRLQSYYQVRSQTMILRTVSIPTHSPIF